MKPRQLAAVLAATLAAAVFAYLNVGERTALNLGFARFYQVPVSWVVFGSFVAGMLVMFGLGLRHDREVRRVLREHERRRGERSPSDEHPGVPM